MCQPLHGLAQPLTTCRAYSTWLLAVGCICRPNGGHLSQVEEVWTRKEPSGTRAVFVPDQ